MNTACFQTLSIKKKLPVRVLMCVCKLVGMYVPNSTFLVTLLENRCSSCRLAIELYWLVAWPFLSSLALVHLCQTTLNTGSFILFPSPVAYSRSISWSWSVGQQLTLCLSHNHISKRTHYVHLPQRRKWDFFLVKLSGRNLVCVLCSLLKDLFRVITNPLTRLIYPLDLIFQRSTRYHGKHFTPWQSTDSGLQRW